MYDLAFRKRARDLRRSGMPVKEVARTLDISSCTASLWLRGTRLPHSIRSRITDKARELGAETLLRLANERHSLWRKDAESSWNVLKKNPLFLLGVGLYWGEGAKLGRRLSISNSDPFVHRTWLWWCRAFIPHVGLRGRVALHPGLNAKKSVGYWKRVLSFPGPILHHVALSRASRGKRPKRILRNGTFVIRASKGSAEWHTKMMRWIQLAGKEIWPHRPRVRQRPFKS